MYGNKERKKIQNLLTNGPSIINVGLKSFHDSNKLQNIQSSHVDWTPPVQGNKKLVDLLDKLI